MPSPQHETRAQSQLRAYAKHHVPRPHQPPLIAPRPSTGGNVEQLPSLQHLQLLKEGRGIHPLPEELAEDTDLLFDGRVLKEYNINGKTSVMQRVEHERRWLHQRTTAGNRRLTYDLEVAQGPQRARACGSGPRCK